MRYTVCFMLFVFTLAFCQTAVAADAVALFDGKSLDNWDYYLIDSEVKKEDVWSVEDGILICKGEPMGYLCTKDDYKNFKLLVEWRWAPGKEPGNSGVLMRITGEPKALPKCLETQLRHSDAGDFYGFHKFAIEGDPARMLKKTHPLGGDLTGVKKIKGNEEEPGEWNLLEVWLEDGMLIAKVNGVKVNEATGCEVVSGKIGFQSEGGEIQFRKIELLSIGK